MKSGKQISLEKVKPAHINVVFFSSKPTLFSLLFIDSRKHYFPSVLVFFAVNFNFPYSHEFISLLSSIQCMHFICAQNAWRRSWTSFSCVSLNFNHVFCLNLGFYKFFRISRNPPETLHCCHLAYTECKCMVLEASSKENQENSNICKSAVKEHRTPPDSLSMKLLGP